MSPVPAVGAWLDASALPTGGLTTSGSPTFGRNMNNYCNNWTNGTNAYIGYAVTPEGGIASSNCNVVRALACCNSAPKTTFAGFTSNDAAMNGRPGMHAQCNAKFAGAHMCHAAEYARAASADPVPANGAWLDASTASDGSLTLNGVPSAGRNMNNYCNNWTNATNAYIGYAVTPEGGIASSNCNVARRIACCL